MQATLEHGEPQPPVVENEVTLVLSQSEAELLRWLCGWCNCVPKELDRLGKFKDNTPNRDELSIFMMDSFNALYNAGIPSAKASPPSL